MWEPGAPFSQIKIRPRALGGCEIDPPARQWFVSLGIPMPILLGELLSGILYPSGNRDTSLPPHHSAK